MSPEAIQWACFFLGFSPFVMLVIMLIANKHKCECRDCRQARWRRGA